MSGRGWAAILAALSAGLAATGAPAAASPPRPADLTVVDGAGWRADPGFQLTWTSPPVGDGPALTAAHYRVRDPGGAVLEEEVAAPTSNAASVRAAAGVPGVYTAEVWLRDAAGELSPAATAQLRFDDARPAAIEPLPLPEWLGRAAFPLPVRLSHPAGPPPLSGIRGYAVSVGGGANVSPCAAADRCTPAETTLPGGAADDEMTIAALPQGAAHLRAVAVSGSGMKSVADGHALLRVDLADPVTRLAGAPAGWTNGIARLTATASDSGSGMAPRSGGPPPVTAIRVGAGAPAIALGGSVSTDVVAEGAHLVAYYARDAAGNVDDGAARNGVANSAPRTAWVRIDRTPPEAGFANSQDPRDPDLIRVRIADPLSGPDPARGWIGIRPAGSGDRFEPLPAAPPAGGELRARWHSDAYPRGVYEFRAIAHDAAGNLTATSRRRDGTAMTLSNPLKAASTLRAGFHRGRLERATPFGRSVRIAGRLTTGRNSPLAGAPLRIVERFAAGARPSTRVSTVRTMPGGGFAHRIAPGPSREIEVSFAGTPTLARSSANTLKLRVRSRVRLRASSRVAKVGGAPIVFRGRVAASARTIPAPESVQLQFRLPGLPWSSFRTLKTNRNGRFRYAYSFSDNDSRGARFQFRAFVPAQQNWPYEPGGSRPVLVRGN
ncbi:MAG: hypothetical protein WDZ46_03515 [Solirubrobacterales bacterium]